VEGKKDRPAALPAITKPKGGRAVPDIGGRKRERKRTLSAEGRKTGEISNLVPTEMPLVLLEDDHSRWKKETAHQHRGRQTALTGELWGSPLYGKKATPRT